MWNNFIRDPDKLRSLEDIFYNSPRGEQLVNQVKRDVARNVIENPNVTERQIRDLGPVLGEQFHNALEQFRQDLNFARQNPRPRAQRGQPIGVNAPTPQTRAIGSDLGPVKPKQFSEAGQHLRKKQSEYLSKKSSDQIMKEMDTIQGIRKMKRALETTEEGKKLFQELSRYKLAEMIDKKMKDSVTQNIKLGTFSNLLKTTKDRAIVKELLGKEAFAKLELLQKNSGLLAKSAERFFNASQSGTTLSDMGTVGAAVTGVLTGNPFITITALTKIGGSIILARLFADKEFLKHLQKVILTKNPAKFNEYLENMRPSVQKAILESQKPTKQEKEAL
jgi:hypothetical protein